MEDNADRIPHLLKQIRLLKDKHAELAAATGEDFNVFSILRIKHREVKTHTPILAELLNPHGSHHQKADFLKLFLKKMCTGSEESTFCNNPESYRVRSEERIRAAQFDIMLEKGKENDKARIVIENKILAADQDLQLDRDARENFDGPIKLIYLTLDDREPSEESLGDLSKDKVQCITYREHIIPWLEECIKLETVLRIAPIREILLQYRDLLKDLTGQPKNTNTVMELSNLLTKNHNYELIPQLEQALLESKVRSQVRFWQDLAEKLSEIDVNRNIEEDETLEECCRNYYVGSKNRSFSRSFKIGSWKKSQITLSIEIEASGRVFYGFCLLDEEDEWVNSCNNEKYDSLAEKLPEKNYQRNDWYIGWKYPTDDLKFPLEYRKSDENYFCFLLNEEKRGEAVRKLAQEIAGEVDKFKKSLS